MFSRQHMFSEYTQIYAENLSRFNSEIHRETYSENLIRVNRVHELINLIENGFIELNSIHGGSSLLFLAVNAKNYTLVESLLNLGIDRTILQPTNYRTALHQACIKGFISIVRLMISTGREDLEITDIYGKTPLRYAIECGNRPIAKFLMENGAVFSYLPQNLINEILYTRRPIIQLLRRSPEEILQRQVVEESRIRSLRMHEILETPAVVQEEKKMEFLRPNKDIIELILSNEISKKSVCPISLEEIQKESAVITNCFHVFSRDNIDNWLRIKNFCPVCKTKCFVL